MQNLRDELPPETFPLAKSVVLDETVDLASPPEIEPFSSEHYASLGVSVPGARTSVEIRASDLILDVLVPPVPPQPAFDVDQAVRNLGVGAKIQVEDNFSFRVQTGDRNPRYGHGKTIESAIYDLYHPGQLKPTMEPKPTE